MLPNVSNMYVVNKNLFKLNIGKEKFLTDEFVFFLLKKWQCNLFPFLIYLPGLSDLKSMLKYNL